MKIGKADNILGRAQSLGLADFDMSKSMGFKVPSSVCAVNLEKFLHAYFAEHQIPPSDVKGVVSHKDGHTEWFSIDCIDLAKGLLPHIRETMPCQEMSAADIQDEMPWNITLRLPTSKWKNLVMMTASEYTKIQPYVMELIAADFARRGLPF